MGMSTESPLVSILPGRSEMVESVDGWVDEARSVDTRGSADLVVYFGHRGLVMAMRFILL